MYMVSRLFLNQLTMFHLHSDAETSMKSRKIIAISAAAGLLALLLVLFMGQGNPPPEQTEAAPQKYIFERNDNISFETVQNTRKKIKTETPPDTDTDGLNEKTVTLSQIPSVDISQFFTDSMVNSETIRYFRFLHRLFRKSADMEEHLDEVKAYLFSQLPKEEAEAIFSIYRDYLQCEIDLVNERKLWGQPTDPEGIIAILAKVQDFRRERLGDEIADALFGADVKAREYAIRRSAIVNDDSLYGEEKARMIRALSEDMWGDDADAVEEFPKPYNRYREKLEIFKKNLEEISSVETRKEKIKEFREEFFEPEIVQRLEEVDRQIELEQLAEKEYRQAEQAIRNDPNLSETEKTGTIAALQDETFGEQADSFRRREAMKKGLEDLKAEVEAKKTETADDKSS